MIFLSNSNKRNKSWNFQIDSKIKNTQIKYKKNIKIDKINK